MKAIRKFIQRFDHMNSSRAKEMRLSFEEARDLMSAITYLMTRKLDENEQDATEENIMDGGGF